MIGRLAAAWANASFALVAALAWLSVSLVSCPQVGVFSSLSMAGVEIGAVIPLLGPITFAIEDDYRNFIEDDFVEDDFWPRGCQVWGLFRPPLSLFRKSRRRRLSPSPFSLRLSPLALLMKPPAPFAEP